MNRRQVIGIVGMMMFAVGAVWAQDNATPPSDSQAPQQPVPAYGQEDAPPPISENPPLSGLDLPSLQEHVAPLSYLQPGATVSESADTNTGNTLGGSKFGSISRALGTLVLRRLWSNYDLALDYMGGVGYYNIGGVGLRQLQQLGLEQKIHWKRGQISFRDSFSYLPEGNFGGGYGSLGSVGIGGLGSSGLSAFQGGSGFGTFGLTPQILNVSLAEVSENLNPKSAVTATGGYAFTHFYGNDVSGASFIGSSQVSAQGGYNRILTPHTQIAAVYGYQGFDFSVAGAAFHTHVVQGMYGHRISGRLDLMLGAGPQLVLINTQSQVCSDPTVPPQYCGVFGDTLMPVTIRNRRVGVAAQARLRYRVSKNNLDLRYERFTTSGAGVFAGAQTDLVSFNVEHPLSRVWTLNTDLGYSHNSRLQPLSPQQIQGCTSFQNPQNACPANNAATYNSGFAGAALHRYFGRQWHGFVSYQFNELAFDQSFCVSGAPCSRISNRQVVTLGLDWTPRPIRID